MPHKAIRMCVLLLLCMLFLSGCQQSTFTMFFGGSASRNFSAKINTSAKTITVDGDVYAYEKRAEYISVVWPDGVTYTEEKQGDSWSEAVSGTINAEKYLSKDEALRVLDKLPEDKSVGWFPVLIILLGAVMLIYPKFFWFLRYGWLFREAEMGTAPNVVFRGIGIVIVVVGIGML